MLQRSASLLILGTLVSASVYGLTLDGPSLVLWKRQALGDGLEFPAQCEEPCLPVTSRMAMAVGCGGGADQNECTCNNTFGQNFLSCSICLVTEYEDIRQRAQANMNKFVQMCGIADSPIDALIIPDDLSSPSSPGQDTPSDTSSTSTTTTATPSTSATGSVSTSDAILTAPSPSQTSADNGSNNTQSGSSAGGAGNSASPLELQSGAMMQVVLGFALSSLYYTLA